jgi:phage terminase large subunit GpA-like protein
MGQLYYIWEKPDRQANEMLDAVIYASAAAIKRGVNAISDTGWKRLEAEFEVYTSIPVEAAPMGPTTMTAAPQSRAAWIAGMLAR